MAHKYEPALEPLHISVKWFSFMHSLWILPPHPPTKGFVAAVGVFNVGVFSPKLLVVSTIRSFYSGLTLNVA